MEYNSIISSHIMTYNQQNKSLLLILLKKSLRRQPRYYISPVLQGSCRTQLSERSSDNIKYLSIDLTVFLHKLPNICQGGKYAALTQYHNLEQTEDLKFIHSQQPYPPVSQHNSFHPELLPFCLFPLLRRCPSFQSQREFQYQI